MKKIIFALTLFIYYYVARDIYYSLKPDAIDENNT